MRFGLNEDTIKEINEVLSVFPEIEEAILYGSRAKGNYKPRSDIDLTLKGDQLNYDLLIRVSRQLDELPIPYMIDLSLLNSIHDPGLFGHIQRVGKVFYSAAVCSHDMQIESLK